MSMHDFYYMRISPEKLCVDDSYQRLVSEYRVRKIIENFDMDLFNAPKVSHRKDGKYYIFDGQHSMVVHKRMFGEDEPINCKVYEGLTYEEEVNLFVQQNGIAREVTTNDKLKALYHSPKSDVREMVKAVETVGLTINFKSGVWTNHIGAVGAAYSIWQLLGKDNFINVLDVIKKAWDGEGNSLSAGMLKGMAYIYKKYGNDIQNNKMVQAIRKHTPDWYAREAKDMKGSLGMRYVKLILAAYNHGKRIRIGEEGGDN